LVQVRLRFYWYDVFKQKSASAFSNYLQRQHKYNKPTSKYKQQSILSKDRFINTEFNLGLYSISFEKVNVLFNVAAFMSQIALQQNRALDESIKICAKYFQVISYYLQLFKRFC
jgi:hypothetical protein